MDSSITDRTIDMLPLFSCKSKNPGCSDFQSTDLSEVIKHLQLIHAKNFSDVPDSNRHSWCCGVCKRQAAGRAESTVPTRRCGTTYVPITGFGSWTSPRLPTGFWFRWSCGRIGWCCGWGLPPGQEMQLLQDSTMLCARGAFERRCDQESGWCLTLCCILSPDRFWRTMAWSE
jgi:hypothetical protein